MVCEQLAEIKKLIPVQVTLVAVSKTQAASAIQEAYNAGQRHFGENKVQELHEKHPQLPQDIHWHLIGHLQTNKVKYIAPFVSLIHSIDSLKLLQEVNKEAVKNSRVINCLLQFHIAQEETKFGLSLDEARIILESTEFTNMKNCAIVGVMGMASFSNNENEVRNEFKSLKSIFDVLKKDYFYSQETFKEISMGMSGDFKIAIEEGSTLVRVGNLIFGSR